MSQAEGKPCVLRSMRFDKIIAKSILKGKQIQFVLDSPYPALFSGYNDQVLEEDKDDLRVEEFITTTTPPTFKPMGKIHLSSYQLEALCPKERTSAVNDDSVSEAIENESDEEVEEEEEDSNGDEDLSDISDEEDVDPSDDSDYEEVSWKTILDNCPDEFTFKSVSVSMDLRVKRTNPDQPRLELTGVKLILLPKRDMSPKRKRQSDDGKKTPRNG
jgi:hypothetical protein